MPLTRSSSCSCGAAGASAWTELPSVAGCELVELGLALLSSERRGDAARLPEREGRLGESCALDSSSRPRAFLGGEPSALAGVGGCVVRTGIDRTA